MQDERETAEFAARDGIWLRGLWMLIMALLIALVEAVLWACAVLQFGWMLFTRERNRHVAEFGAQLGHWLATAARFQCGTSEAKPFPWTAWK